MSTSAEHWPSAGTAQRRSDDAAAELPRAQSEEHAAGRDLELLLALTLALAAGLVGLYWSYTNNLLLAYNDAMGHLNIARRVLDSRTPGLVQLGTVWLPLPHLLMQPFIYSDFLWRSGMAASIVGLACFVITAVALFQSIRLITTAALAPWIGLAIFITNPNMLYMQTTALTEPVLLMAVTTSSYALLLWSKSRAPGHLTAAGLLALLAVWSRYDGWFFACCGGLIVLATIVLGPLRERGRLPLAATWRGRPRPTRLTLAGSAGFLYGLIPVYGMLGWIFYNWVIFGDPLEFQRGQYSAGYQQSQAALAGQLPTRHNLDLSLTAYFWAMYDNLGAVILACAAAGVLLYILTVRLRADGLVPYLFLAALPFNVLALWLGQTIIRTLHTSDNYFNVRYGLLLLPAAALFIAYAADWLLRRIPGKALVALVGALLVAQFALWAPGWPMSIATVADGLLGASSSRLGPRPEESSGKYLADNYTGGGILIDDDFYFVRSFIEAGLDMREYIAVFSGPLYHETLRDPASHVEWIVLTPRSSITQQATVQQSPDFANRYTPVFEDKDQGITIYRRNLAVGMPGAPPVPASSGR